MELRTRRTRWAAFLFCLALLSPVSEAARQPWKRRPGVVLYHLKESASSEERAVFSRLQIQHQARAAAAFEPLKSHHAVLVDTGGKDEEDIADELKASGAVDFAEPDYLMPAASAVPNDPQYGSQWFHQTIHSPAAWSYTTGNSSVLVAVCDTGVDAAHPDLAANMSLPGYNVVDHTTRTDPVAAHGTEVAGLVAGVGNNALGITGMNWSAKILPVRITNNADMTAWCSDMASGIEWAADHGAKVVNLSYDTVGCPGTIEAASAYAQARGALVVVAAGNDAEDISAIYPASPSFILVGATDISDHQIGFSNYGPQVRVAAPGMSILTTQPGGYASANGTSMAAPIVAGLAALIYAINPNWSPSIVRNLIFATAAPVGPPTIFGYGRIDAGAALAAAQNCFGGQCLVPNPVGFNPPPAQPTDPAHFSVVAADLSDMRVYPNPWRSDRHPNFPITFDHLVAASEVKIFTVSGHEVRHVSGTGTSLGWDLKTDSGDPVASGLYLYLVTNNLGQQARGKLAVIR